jgi:hypothetical protein
MSLYYQIIRSDLLEEEPTSVVLPVLPDLSLYDTPGKILILFDCYNRASIRGNREQMLYYLFHIGKVIFPNNLSLRNSGLSPYYYKVSKRIYLLFERDEFQIMRSKLMTTRDVNRITRNELDDLLNLIP